jgi:hypothetical protein
MSPAQARETYKNGNPWPISLAEAQRLAQIERSQRNESPETKKTNDLLYQKFLKGRNALLNLADS